jgi:hypothetical protein
MWHWIQRWSARDRTTHSTLLQVMKMVSVADPPTAIITTEKEALTGVLRALNLDPWMNWLAIGCRNEESAL